MASEPWPPSDVGKRTSWTESRETLPCTMPTRAGAPPPLLDLTRAARRGRGSEPARIGRAARGVAALENSGKLSNFVRLEGPARLRVP